MSLADNVNYTPGHGVVIAADSVDGILYQRVKIATGADGAATDLSSTSPLPTQLYGTTDGGTNVAVPISAEGHLEVEIHGPLNPFGSVHTENLTPVFQTDFVYGINATETAVSAYKISGATGTSASATAANNLLTLATGTTALSAANAQSVSRLRYRSGQGLVARYTAIWSAPQASTTVIAGCGTGEAGFFFGYNGTEFGVLHNTDGVREIQTLTISAATSTGGTVVLTVGGIATTITLPTAGSIARTAYDISQQSIDGWTMEAVGTTVVFLANLAKTWPATFTLALGTALGTAGTFAQTVAGVAQTNTWVAQTAWNGDVCDGTGNSGFTLNPALINVFQIGVTYLGSGPVRMSIFIPATGGNNSTIITVHTFNFTNSATSVSVTQPSFPFTATAVNTGSATGVTVSVGSYAGFIEGQIRLTGPRLTYFDSSVAVTTTNYYTLQTIRNDLVYKGRANQGVINLISFGGAHDDTTPVTLFLIKNATLVGTPVFAQYSTSSMAFTDTAATTCTFSDNNQLVQAIPLGQGGNDLITFDDPITLQPGETITIAAQTVFGTSAYTITTLNTREDQ
jgi:hypothetical protein